MSDSALCPAYFTTNSSLIYENINVDVTNVTQDISKLKKDTHFLCKGECNTAPYIDYCFYKNDC